MTLISLSQVEKSFGDRTIFSDVSLRIDEKDRIGVIGDNGAGKTTLMNLITGQDIADRGERSTRRDLSIAWTNQIPILNVEQSLIEAAQASFSELDQMEVELRRLEDEMAKSPEDNRLHDRHEHVHVAFEAAGGYRREQAVERARSLR